MSAVTRGIYFAVLAGCYTAVTGISSLYSKDGQLKRQVLAAQVRALQ